LRVEIVVFFQSGFFSSISIRLIQVYLVQGLVFLFFLSLAIIILRRDRKRLNKIFAGFYVLVSLGLFFNFIYAPMRNDSLVVVIEVFNFLTNFSLLLGPIFLVIFQLILLKSEKIITKKKQMLIIISYAAVLSIMIAFMFGTETGVDINSGTLWIPIYHLPIYIFIIVVHSIGSTIPTVYLSIKVLKKLTNPILKNKWKYFMVGIHSLNFFLYGTYSSYILEVIIHGFRFGWSVAGFFIVIVGGYLLFYGVGRQLEKEEL